MHNDNAVLSIFAQALACTETSWSIGEYGAIAEFHHADASAKVRGLSLVAAGGGVAINEAPGLVLAYEMPSGRPGLWMHGVVLCIRADEAAMHGHRVITALGPDRQALNEADRETPLFDLGLGLSTVDFCVRTAEADTVRALEQAVGSSLFDNPALYAHLQAAGPPRVLVSRVGRIEVLSRIPTAAEHSPPGPHTHLLPDLLRTRRRFSANLPIPEGWVPALFIHPPNPLYDAMGQRRAFDPESHEQFQALLARHGDPAQLEVKRTVVQAIRDKRLPPGRSERWTRHQRLAARVALRQLAALEPDSDSPALQAWQQFLDRADAMPPGVAAAKRPSELQNHA